MVYATDCRRPHPSTRSIMMTTIIAYMGIATVVGLYILLSPKEF